MKVYWTLRQVPGLAVFPKSERGRALRSAIRQHVGAAQRLLYALPGGIGAGMGIWIGHRVTAAHGDFASVLLCVVGAWIGGVIGQSLLIQKVAPFLPAAGVTHPQEPGVGSTLNR